MYRPGAAVIVCRGESEASKAEEIVGTAPHSMALSTEEADEEED